MTQSSGPGATRKLTAEHLDLMKPGNGTPWEDRGTTGAFVAYFKTVMKCFTAPSLLLDHISRPESTEDSFRFGIISCVMWSLGIFGWNAYYGYYYLPDHQELPQMDDPTNFWITAVIQAVLVGGGAFAWMKFGAKMFYSLGATELKRVPPSLINNCFAYAMGPSILALVPVYGWAAAYLWIFYLHVVTGRSRLYMKPVSAIMNPVLISFCVLATAVVAYYALGWLWSDHLNMGGIYHPDADNPDSGTSIPAIAH